MNKEEIIKKIQKVKKYIIKKLENKEQLLNELSKTKEFMIKIFHKLVVYIKKNYPAWEAKAIKYYTFIKAKYLILNEEFKRHPKIAKIIGSLLILFLVMLLSLTDNSKKQESPVLNVEVTVPTKTPEVIEDMEDIIEEEISDEDIIIDNTKDEEKENKDTDKVVLNFTAKTIKPISFDVYYTNKREVWFDAQHYVTHQGQSGIHTYSIVLPEEVIYRIRLDFGTNPGKVTIKNIYLSGGMQYDLNDFSIYEFKQLENIKRNKDGSLTFTSTGDDPYMAYRRMVRHY